MLPIAFLKITASRVGNTQQYLIFTLNPVSTRGICSPNTLKKFNVMTKMIIKVVTKMTILQRSFKASQLIVKINDESGQRKVTSPSKSLWSTPTLYLLRNLGAKSLQVCLYISFSNFDRYFPTSLLFNLTTLVDFKLN